MSGKGSARVEVERVLPFPLASVREAVAEPERMADWIEPLNSLEPQGDGEYLADVGYFGHPNRHRMRPIADGPDVYGIESVAPDANIRWTTSLASEGNSETLARFTYEKGGSGTVFGVSADSPIFVISVEVLCERSLERLERILAGTETR